MAYTFMGIFPVLRRQLHAESKRVGYDRKQKKDFIAIKIGKSTTIKDLTISQLEFLIDELRNIK